MNKLFETQVSGKWILTGEHAVLRGCPALVFPLKARRLELTYGLTQDKSDLSIELLGEHGGELQMLFWGVLERACELKKWKRSQFVGHLVVRSGIPIGAGLGASAALCVAVCRWFCFLRLLTQNEIADFATQLENLFHGESSGVDIAVAMAEQPLCFVRHGERKHFAPVWQPEWYVSFSGQRGVTLECVRKVKALLLEDPSRAAQIDQQMERSTDLALSALEMSGADRFSVLASAIDGARDCFQQWGLAEGAPQQHMAWLKDQGAFAVKPTGSGQGGYVLSLWQKPPPESIRGRLISCS